MIPYFACLGQSSCGPECWAKESALLGGLLTQFGLVSIPNWFGKMVDFSGFGTPEGRLQNAPYFFDLSISFFCVNEQSSLSRSRHTLGQAAKETKENRPAPTAPHGAGSSARRT